MGPIRAVTLDSIITFITRKIRCVAIHDLPSMFYVNEMSARPHHIFMGRIWSLNECGYADSQQREINVTTYFGLSRPRFSSAFDVSSSNCSE